MRALLLAAVAIASSSFLSHGQDPPTQDVHVAAERFSFTPSEIRTTVGTTLRITLQSDDTNHGFHIVGSDVDIEIPKRGRGETTVSFTPDKAGRYTFECSRLCGAGHSFMRGTIVVSDGAAKPEGDR